MTAAFIAFHKNKNRLTPGLSSSATIHNIGKNKYKIKTVAISSTFFGIHLLAYYFWWVVN